MFGALAGALTVVPSQAAASSPHRRDPGPVPSGPASRQNSSSNGLAPSRHRSPASAVDDGTCHPAAASAPPSPQVSFRSTSRYGVPACRHSPSTKYTPSRPGSARNRCPAASCPASASTSSASPGVTHRAGTPTRTPARTLPKVDDHRLPMAA